MKPPPVLKYMLVVPSATATNDTSALPTRISISAAHTRGSSEVGAILNSEGFADSSISRRAGVPSAGFLLTGRCA